MGVGLAFPEDIDGTTAALEYLTGYVLEKSLSLDNIFVIAIIFAHFRVPLQYQHRVLFYGILGALVMRGAMIAAGATLIARFDWVTYVFGTLLLVTAVRLLVVRSDTFDPESNIVFRLVRRFYPVSSSYDEDHFFTRLDGRRVATPLFLALVLVETTDLFFAVDSIPAIFAVTDDPFIVYTSNVFAVLGLRSLYFALAPFLGILRFLKASLVFVLAFVGVKMLLVHHHPIPTPVSLAVISGILFVGIVGSLVAPDSNREVPHPPLTPPSPGPEPAVPRGVTKLRILLLAVGSGVVLWGGVLVALPGPGVLVLLAGLLILATQVAWGLRLVRNFKRTK